MTPEATPTPWPPMQGHVALVAGGTGNVGRVVVEEFLASGATVVVPSRSKRKLSALRNEVTPARTERLVTIPGNLSDQEDALRVRKTVSERVGPLDSAVASLGRFVPAPKVLEASPGDLQRVIDGYLLSHFMVVKVLLPLLEERSGAYTFINGPLAFRPMFPGTGLVSVATAGQAMLAQMVMKEHGDGPIRINEVVIHTRFGGEGEQGGAIPQKDVARFLCLLASPAGRPVRGETIHLSSREPLQRLTHGT